MFSFSRSTQTLGFRVVDARATVRSYAPGGSPVPRSLELVKEIADSALGLVLLHRIRRRCATIPPYLHLIPQHLLLISMLPLQTEQPQAPQTARRRALALRRAHGRTGPRAGGDECAAERAIPIQRGGEHARRAPDAEGGGGGARPARHRARVWVVGRLDAGLAQRQVSGGARCQTACYEGGMRGRTRDRHGRHAGRF